MNAADVMGVDFLGRKEEKERKAIQLLLLLLLARGPKMRAKVGTFPTFLPLLLV